MSYKVLIHPKIKKKLDKNPQLKKRFKDKLTQVSENPFNFLEKHKTADYYKLRIGGYRALIDVDFARKILFVRVFDKREKIYKRKY